MIDNDLRIDKARRNHSWVLYVITITALEVSAFALFKSLQPGDNHFYAQQRATACRLRAIGQMLEAHFESTNNLPQDRTELASVLAKYVDPFSVGVDNWGQPIETFFADGSLVVYSLSADLLSPSDDFGFIAKAKNETELELTWLGPGSVSEVMQNLCHSGDP